MTKRMLAASAALALAACGGGGGGAGGGPAPGADDAGAAASVAVRAIDPASIPDPATITGTVRFAGDVPGPEIVPITGDPFCVVAHQGAEVAVHRVVASENGALRHVFVYVKEGLEGRSFVVPGVPARVTQAGCTFEPHVIGMQAGQTLQIHNGDETMHNVYASPVHNRDFNIAQPVAGMTYEIVFRDVEVMISLSCDLHPWMRAYVGVVGSPYHAVTGEDGSFEIGGLPPGDYVVAAWHETMGEQTRQVSVAAGDSAEIAFSFGG